jgi:hypothetical protein
VLRGIRFGVGRHSTIMTPVAAAVHSILPISAAGQQVLRT